MGTGASERAAGQGAVGAFAANGLHRRWRSIVVSGVLAGIVAGIGVASLAGARRTDSLFDRYFAASRSSQLELDPGTPTIEADKAIRAMPEVESAAYWATVAAFPLDEQGQLDLDFVGSLNFTTDGRFLDQDVVTVSAGRRLDPTKPDEVMLNESFAEFMHATVGTKLNLGLVPTDDQGVPTQLTPTSTVSAKVVGIMVFPDDVISSAIDRIPKMFVSPAFGHLLDDPDPTYVGFSWYGLRLKNGYDDVDSVVARWQGIADQHNVSIDPDSGQQWLTYVHRTSDVRRAADRSVRPMVAALATFGGLVLLGSIILLAQGLARGVRLAREDLRLGQMLGLSARQSTRIAMVAPIAIVLIAAVTAAATAVVGSWRFPAGPLRVLEPDTGFDVDLLVIGPALAGLIVIPVAVAGLVARQQSRQPILGDQHGTRRTSRLTTAMAAVGAPLPVLSAVRLTVEPGRGQTFVPTRLVLLTSVTTVVLLVTTIVFGHNMSAVADEPERFGWRADGVLMIDGGYGKIDPDASIGWLDSRDDLDGWRLLGADHTAVGGRETPGLLLGPGGGDGERLSPVLVTGRSPDHAGEVVMGRRTMSELHLRVGDSVSVGGADTARDMRITGVAVFPEVGPALAVRPRLDDGIWVHPDDAAVFSSLSAYGSAFNALFIDMAAGHSTADFYNDASSSSSPLFHTDQSVDGYGVLRPIEVENATTAARAQAALVAAVAIVAVISLLLTLVTVVRRRRRDLSILAALGFTPRQLRTTVLVQGLLFGLAGAIVGTPIGVVLGRQLWHGFADTLGVVAEPTVPWLAVTICVIATIAVGFISAVAPSISAGRLDNTRWSRE